MSAITRPAGAWLALTYPLWTRPYKEADTPCFRLDDSRILQSEAARPGVVLDGDPEDRVEGVEFLGMPSRAAPERLSSLQFHTAWTAR